MLSYGIQGVSASVLERVRVPRLVVWGAHDTVDSVSAGRRTAALLQARFVTVPKAGHLSMLAQGHPYELSSYDELVQKALMTLNYKIGSFLADNCPGTLTYHSQEACPDGERADSW